MTNSQFPEFKNYDDSLNIPSGWVDISWHNNSCPSIAKAINPVTNVVIWCDYKTFSKRESGCMHQFLVSIDDDQDMDVKGYFDDIESAILFGDALLSSLTAKG